jgi:hypothetical protein
VIALGHQAPDTTVPSQNVQGGSLAAAVGFRGHYTLKKSQRRYSPAHPIGTGEQIGGRQATRPQRRRKQVGGQILPQQVSKKWNRRCEYVGHRPGCSERSAIVKAERRGDTN